MAENVAGSVEIDAADAVGKARVVMTVRLRRGLWHRLRFAAGALVVRVGVRLMGFAGADFTVVT